jgi:type I restriction enzyme, S subunit
MSKVVPDGWFAKSLDEIVVFIKDGTHGTHKRLNEGIPLLSAKNISSDGHINCDSSDSLISEVEYQKIHAKYAIEENDILLTVVGTLGRTALVPKGFRKFTLQRSVAIIRLDVKTIHPDFCYQYLSGDELQRQLSLRSNSTAQAGVYLGELGRISIPIPPLPEQQKIASILTSVDEVIEKTQSQIKKLEDLKKGTMNELLTRGIGHTEFKDSPVGRIPKGWEVISLSEMISIKHGYAFEGEHFTTTPNEYILLTPGNFHRDGYLYFGQNTKYFTGEIPENYVLSNGDLLIVMTDLTKEMTILGNTIILSSPLSVLHNQRIGKIDFLNKSLDKTYLNIVMNSYYVKEFIKITATGTTVRHTAPSKVLDIRIPIPSLREQQEIASILSSIDTNIEETQRKLQQNKSLKKSLMQDLLTGKVRVSVH